jgi:rod shape determining protein RodA
MIRHYQPGCFKFTKSEMPLREKIWQINWTLILLLTLVASVGFMTLYSAAGGKLEPWAMRQMMRFGVGLCVMIVVALIDIRFWMKHAYMLYLAGMVLLVVVEVRGSIGMGAQRWIDLGFIQLQPSEIMKIVLPMCLARYFHGASYQEVGRPLFLVPPLMIVLAPAIFVLKQPDLGTAMMLLMTSACVFFLAGVRIWKFLLVACAAGAIMPIAWEFMREYQRKRVLTFLNPENDPLGAGYHIIQSKIALGSGGVLGKGFLLGTQSHLNFLPEKQTDFIFTQFAEEWGMVGGVALIGLYGMVVAMGYAISLRSKSQFGKLMGLGITSTFFLYVFINTAMVMGLVPVVGVPLPLISYGGTAMMTLLFGFGLIMSVYIHRDIPIGRRGAYDD